jgi:hypothetical protein
MKIEAILLWLLVSLLAISFVGDHPLLGLAIAIVGGVVLGILLVVDGMRGPAGK